MKKQDIRTYDDYISLKNNPTYPFLMISELIDNSISSFDNHYGVDKWEEKLRINIDFYFNKKQTRIIHGTKAETNSYIKVVDNAFGMDEATLIDAVRLNKKNTTSISTKNRHGRGLKQCAFYFGADLDIETWNDNNEISNIKLSTSVFDSSDEVTLETFSLGQNDLEHIDERGTAIVINNIYSNKSFTDLKYNKLIEAISYRYIKLIKAGKMEIWYTDDIKNEYSKFTNKQETDEHIEIVNENFKYNKEKTMEVINDSKNYLETFKINGTGGAGAQYLSKYEDLADETVECISNLLIESVTEPNLKFEWSQTLDINGKKLRVRFWKLKKQQGKHRGYRVYEGDRALLHPPMTDDDVTTYHKGVFPTNNESGSTENRFAGEFDILDINATTSTDKSKFIFEDQSDEEVLNSKLLMIWKIFNTFEMRGRSDTKDSEGKDISNKESQQIVNVARSKFGKNIDQVRVIEDKDGNNGIGFDLKVNDDSWEIEIQIDKKIKPKKIWDRRIMSIDKGNKMIITAFTAHPIWRRMDSTKEFMSESLIPISIFVAHYEIMNIIDGTSGKSIDEIDISKIISPIDKMNKSGEIIDE